VPRTGVDSFGGLSMQRVALESHSAFGQFPGVSLSIRRTSDRNTFSRWKAAHPPASSLPVRVRANSKRDLAIPPGFACSFFSSLLSGT
jgi:hypothetical protein